MPTQNKHKLTLRSDAKRSKYEAAKELIEKHQIITISGTNHSTIYLYENGIYVDGEKQLRNEIQNIYEEEATTNLKNEIITKIQDITYLKFEDTQKDDYNLLPLANGVFDIRTSEIIDYDPGYYFFTKLPVKYNPEADCPVHKKFFSEVLEEYDISLIQELFGFSLFRRMFLKKAFLFVGEKNTGKSTMLKIFNNLIGIKNISGVSLQKLSKDKFAIANLYLKYLNIYDDLDAQGINNHGSFKIASGGGLVSGEKKFGDEFQFINYAKSIFACNKIPDVKAVDDDAYFDRWVIINFAKKIEKIDVFLDDKLKTEEEVSGLLNFALEGLHRLLKNTRFSNYKTSEDTKLCMLKNSNSISSFAQDWLSAGFGVEDGTFTMNEELYSAYQLYCMEYNLPLQTEAKFHRDIATYCPYIVKTTSSLNIYAKQMRGYSNVLINLPKKVEEKKL